MSATPIGLIFDLPDTPQATFIPWGQGTYALFGKNGVGKSRVLSAINHLFHGGTPANSRRYGSSDGRSSCSVVVKAHFPTEPNSETLEPWERKLRGFLNDYLEQAYDGALIGTSEAWELYEEHIRYLIHLGELESDDVGEALQRLLRPQHYFEISRDELDDLVVRPFYLESTENPELSAHLVDLNAMSMEEKEPTSSWCPLDVEPLATLDGGQICTAVLNYGLWVKSPDLSLTEATGHTCLDLRTSPQPDSHSVGAHLAQMLEDGADHVSWAKKLSKEATREFHRSLPTSVGLHVRVPTHAELLRGESVAWSGTVTNPRAAMGRPEQVEMEQLSTAERTWARLAIHRALASESADGNTILLVDEPEAGLHRGAERGALGWFTELGAATNTWTWCATHSPVLLNDDRVLPIAVRQELSVNHHDEILFGSTMRRLGSAERDELESLGLGPTDLLTLRRGFLLVEGEHDDIVLTELIGPDLSKLRVEVLPMRGARKLPGAIEARTLFEFTDTLVFALLDAIPVDGTHEVWTEAKKYAKDPERALAVLSEGFTWPPGEESEWMKEWLMRSIKRGRGRHSRVEPLGVAAADIIEYLPVHHFVPTAQSWEELRAQHKFALESTNGTPKDFKKWLTAKHKADFGPDSLREACQHVSEIPGDFTKMLASIGTALTGYERQRPV